MMKYEYNLDQLVDVTGLPKSLILSRIHGLDYSDKRRRVYNSSEALRAVYSLGVSSRVKDLTDLTGVARQTISQKLKSLSYVDEKNRLYDTSKALKELYKADDGDLMTITDIERKTGFGRKKIRNRLNGLETIQGKYKFQDVMPRLYRDMAPMPRPPSDIQRVASPVNTPNSAVSELMSILEENAASSVPILEETPPLDISDIDIRKSTEETAFRGDGNARLLIYLDSIGYKSKQCRAKLKEMAKESSDPQILIYLDKAESKDRVYTSGGRQVTDNMVEKMSLLTLRQANMMRYGKVTEQYYLDMTVGEIKDHGDYLESLSDHDYKIAQGDPQVAS